MKGSGHDVTIILLNLNKHIMADFLHKRTNGKSSRADLAAT